MIEIDLAQASIEIEIILEGKGEAVSGEDIACSALALAWAQPWQCWWRDHDDDMIMMTVMHGPDDDMMFVNNSYLDCCSRWI